MDIEAILEAIVLREGRYVNHPADKGGPTCWGITLRTLEAWRQSPQTPEMVAGLSKEEAKDIYRERYVEPFRGDVVASVLPQVVDIAVLHGVRRAKEFIAKLRKEGRLTNAALMVTRIEFIADIVKDNPSQRVFLKGWLRRALEVGGVRG